MDNDVVIVVKLINMMFDGNTSGIRYFQIARWGIC